MTPQRGPAAATALGMYLFTQFGVLGGMEWVSLRWKGLPDPDLLGKRRKGVKC